MAVVENRHNNDLPHVGVDRVGLLGGSFNPAHEGHRHISLEALKRLQLDEIWWLVSPQNPLKNIDGMAPLETRLEEAKRVSRSSKIRVTDIEAKLDTRFTVDTLTMLKNSFINTSFVWLMGADNLLQIPKWREWESLFYSVPVAVFNRSSYSQKALAGTAARQFAKFRLGEHVATELAECAPPAWVFIQTEPHPASATQIRRTKVKMG